MTSFSDYLNNRQSAFESVTAKLKQDTFQKTSNDDDKYWKPTMGKDGTGYAVIRFLPGKDVNASPWVKLYSHGFQGDTGRWYIENSLTTLGQADPVSELNTKLWNSGIESNKDVVRKQKRRTNYYANVLVLKDPENPSNEGQVKIYRFGQKIFDKLMEAMQPEFADEKAINPFDMIEGANFRIKLRTVAGYWNYDASAFENAGPVSEDESKLEAIYNAQHDVQALVAPSEFKSYDELKAKLDEVLGSAPETAAPTETTYETKSEDFSAAFSEPTTATPSSNAVDDDSLEDYFKNLAAD